MEWPKLASLWGATRVAGRLAGRFDAGALAVGQTERAIGAPLGGEILVRSRPVNFGRLVAGQVCWRARLELISWASKHGTRPSNCERFAPSAACEHAL